MLQSKLRIQKNKEKDTTGRASILPEDIPLEFQVLLCACRVFLGTEEPARLEEILGRGPDWDRLIALAGRHKVMPLLYRSLRLVDSQAFPQDQMARLRVLYMHNAAQNFQKTRELSRVLKALQDAGIRALPLKGPVLAHMLYGDIALRQFSDLDVLVAPQDVKKAAAAIKEAGYSGDEFSDAKSEALLKTDPHGDLYNKASGIKVELHWRITANFYCLPSDVASLINRSKPITIEGNNLRSVSYDDLLLMLCQHGARHSWECLSWLCDVAMFLKNSDAKWQSALKVDRSANSRACLLGLLLSRDLLGIDFTGDINEILDDDRNLENYARGMVRQFLLDETAYGNEQLREINRNYFYTNMFGSPVDKIKCFLSLATSPTSAEFSSIELPDRMLPIYRIIRPVRLVCTYVKESLERHS